LVAAGHHTSVLVRSSSNLDQIDAVRDALHVFRVDERYDGLPAILSEAKPDIVFHLATYFVAEHCPEDIERLLTANILFPCRLLEAMAGVGIKNFINTGSGWQHFEDRAYRPLVLHAATKQAFEDLMEFYVDTGQVRATTLKLCDTYGPGDPRPKLFSLLFRLLESGEPLAMSPGEQELDLVYIDDVVAAYLMAAQRLLGGGTAPAEAFAVSSRRPVALRKVVAMFEEAMGCRLNIQWGGRPYRPREMMRPWSTGRLLPGWTARIDLPTGLRLLAQRRFINSCV
jgi:nucleoside-diphosphate-sugar epimerase